MIQVYKTPSLLKKTYPKLTWSVPKADGVCLTFDDGPHPSITPWVLAELAKRQAKATFFCVGDNIDKYPETAREIIRQGHQLANHTYHHLRGWDYSSEKYLSDVEKCSDSIQKIDSGQKWNVFRPPYGRIKKSQIKELQQLGYQLIMWSHLSWDFDRKVNIQKSIQSLQQANDGSILVFHDSEKAFPQLKQILPPLLDYFCEANIQMNTLL